MSFIEILVSQAFLIGVYDYFRIYRKVLPFTVTQVDASSDIAHMRIQKLEQRVSDLEELLKRFQ